MVRAKRLTGKTPTHDESADDAAAFNTRVLDIARAVHTHGLVLFGGFHAKPSDDVPGLADGRPAASVLLVGNLGPAMWQRFSKDRGGGDNPLDDWAQAKLTAVAHAHGGEAVFPGSGPPYAPFQRWAQRAGPFHPSPLGLLIHPDFGLWHAFRGALLFADRLPLPRRDMRPSPCRDCADRPCLDACPVGAFSGTAYHVPACTRHIAGPAGGDCIALGCRARRACPEGRAYIYEPAQARHHMTAFLRNNRTDRPA